MGSGWDFELQTTFGLRPSAFGLLFASHPGLGSPAARLGKVLYEISTGRDRNEFPDLPDGFADVREEARWLEFNEMLLKACHCDARQRYPRRWR